MDIETVLELNKKIEAQNDHIKRLEAKLKYAEEVLQSKGVAIMYPPFGVIDYSKGEYKFEE